jgi:nucleoside 2-deoxyribosyltransferase
MRVYISGKIGEDGLTDATLEKFSKAEAMLKARGFETFNPTNGRHQQIVNAAYGRLVANDWNTRMSHYEFMLMKDLRQLVVCDAIYMLPDFLDSKGAKAEYAFAIATGKQVYYADELFADGTLRSKSYEKNRLPEVAP